MLTISFYVMIELATFKLKASIELQEEKIKINTSIQVQEAVRKNVSISFTKTEFGLKNETITQVRHYSLKRMTKDIINDEKLKCEYTPEKHKQYLQTLEEGKVNFRASNCKSYMKSLYDAIYPEGINQRKK